MSGGAGICATGDAPAWDHTCNHSLVRQAAVAVEILPTAPCANNLGTQISAAQRQPRR